MSELESIPYSSENDAVPITLATTYDYSSLTNWPFDVGVIFVQKFRVQETGIPNFLYIRMGSNQLSYGAKIKFLRDEEVIFKLDYPSLKQRTSDWTTEFALPSFPYELVAGEWISFEISVKNRTSIEPLFDEMPDYPKNYLGPHHTEFTLMAARFFLVGISNEPQPEENTDL